MSIDRNKEKQTETLTSGEIRISQRRIVQELVQIPLMRDGAQVLCFFLILEGFAVHLGLLCFTVDDRSSQSVGSLFRSRRLIEEASDGRQKLSHS